MFDVLYQFSNYILVIFLVDIAMLIWLSAKYIKALDKVIECLSSGEKVGIPGLSKEASKTSLMSNFDFLNALFSREYQQSGNVKFIQSMDEARRYFILQFCFGFVLFLLPIVA
ncbi:MAG: hypothetical protein L3J26_11665 [Candidatus Polarisedimenticolaceae bacterium]|nr:hypothetical protein [Candidatus Polarisedimenticolaceae bacterium]